MPTASTETSNYARLGASKFSTMQLKPNSPLAKLYLKHAIKAGLALHDAKRRIEELHEDPNSAQLNELGRTASRHAGVCEAILATAHELLDGDSFTAFCRDAGVERWSVDEALQNVHANLPDLPT